MKKILLCWLFTATVVGDVISQSAVTPGIPAKPSAAKVGKGPGISTGKTTVSAIREYNYFDYMLSLNAQDTSLVHLWGDPSILQEFHGGGTAAVSYVAAGQIIQPTNPLWNDGTNPNFIDLVWISPYDTYTVDSLTFTGAYIGGRDGGDAGKVDTIYLSVGAQDNTAYHWDKATAPWITAYTTKDTLRATAPVDPDSTRNAARSYGTGMPAAVTWPVYLSAADRALPDPVTGEVALKRFAFRLPATLTIPAGMSVSYSVSFKSADTWIADMDTISNFDHLALLFGGNSTASGAMEYYYEYGDHSMSSLMFSGDRARFVPTIAIEGSGGSADFLHEYFASSIVVNCPTCERVAVNEYKLAGGVKAYPNPAVARLDISFKVKEAAVVAVNISNLLGQVITTRNLGSQAAGETIIASFSTADLAPGIYCYTIDVDGARITDRFTVAH